MTTTDFLEAVKKGDLPTVELSLKNTPSLASVRDSQGVSALLLSVFHRQPSITDRLLATRPDLDLFEAATVGNLPRIRHLLEVDRTQLAAFTSQGFTPLGLAAFFGQRDVVAELLQRGAVVDQADRSFNGNTALDAAVAGNHTETALLLLEHGARANVRDKAHFTPLHKAAHHPNKHLIEALLAHGADIRARTADGRLPIDFLPAGDDDLRDRLDCFRQ